MCRHAHKNLSHSAAADELSPGTIGHMFDRLHGLAADQVFSHMSRTMHAVDLSFSQLTTLFRLYRHGPQRIGDLAKAVNLSPCATSRLVARLVTENMVAKHPNPDNKRERLVCLLPAGQDYIKELQHCTAAAYEALFCRVPAELRAKLLHVLEETSTYLPHTPSG